MPALHSVCPLDCPDRCSLDVRVVDGRVTSITGSRVHPLTDGFICAKVRDFPQRVYGPDRLLHPMRRAGPKGSGRFERVSWDEAVGEIARKFALIDPRRTMSGQYVDMHLPVFPGTDGAVALAMIGHLERAGAVDRAFLEQHTVGWEKLLERARPWTLERAATRARVEARDIAAIAEAFAAADPALVRCGWGLERNRNGESSVAAVLALPAVAGKFGRPGGGYALSSSPGYGVDEERLIGVPEATTRVVNMNRLGRALLEETDPPIEALFVYNANPVVTVPDQNRIVRGLEREDLFTVVFDQVMTDTALYADIALPATTFLEHTELSASYGTYVVMLGEPVIEPAGEAKPNEEVFGLIMDKMEIRDEGPRGERLLEEALAAISGPLTTGEGAFGRD